jgi:hypothetical protein
MAYCLDFIQLCCILLTFSFTFSPFESLAQNFDLFQNGSKFWNFGGLGNGESWKSRTYLSKPALQLRDSDLEAKLRLILI